MPTMYDYVCVRGMRSSIIEGCLHISCRWSESTVPVTNLASHFSNHRFWLANLCIRFTDCAWAAQRRCNNLRVAWSNLLFMKHVLWVLSMVSALMHPITGAHAITSLQPYWQGQSSSCGSAMTTYTPRDRAGQQLYNTGAYDVSPGTESIVRLFVMDDYCSIQRIWKLPIAKALRQ